MLTWTTGSLRPNPRLATLHLLRLPLEEMEEDPRSQTTRRSPPLRDLDTAETTSTRLRPPSPQQGSETATWVTCWAEACPLTP